MKPRTMKNTTTIKFRTTWYRLLFFLILSGFQQHAFSQDFPVTVTGKVTSSEDNSGLPGVNILIVGTSTGTTTNADGDYQIAISDPGSILSFSFVGFATQEVVVRNQNVINVTLLPDQTQLGEVVVVGYGTQL